MAGFVYVMSNLGFDGRVKIGKSIKDPNRGPRGGVERYDVCARAVQGRILLLC